jgi:hypothetical protein
MFLRSPPTLSNVQGHHGEAGHDENDISFFYGIDELLGRPHSERAIRRITSRSIEAMDLSLTSPIDGNQPIQILANQMGNLLLNLFIHSSRSPDYSLCQCNFDQGLDLFQED